MRKTPNSIQIELLRRGIVSAKFEIDHRSSPNFQEETSDQLFNTQDFSTKIFSHDQQDVPRLTSPDNAHTQEINEENTNKEQSKDINELESNLSTSNIFPQQQLLCDSNEIPNKTSWSTRRKVLVGFLLPTVIGAMIITGIVLAVLFTRSGDATATASSSSSSSSSTTTIATTTVASTIISAYWSFDNTPTDLYGVYDGSTINGATFSAGAGLSVPFIGYGQSLLLSSASSQQCSVPKPFLPLSSTSFTIEAWIYPTTFTGDRGIFGQCQCSTCQNQCFFFICRSGRLYVGFTLNDLFGATTMTVNTWYHVAFVYNYQTQQQILYLNGVQDAISNNEPPYQGTSGSIQIGSTQVYGTTNYFTGYIDSVMVTTRAKSSSEILRDASLVVYYSFDLPNPNADGGPNQLNGIPNNTVTTAGRVNQAMRFIGQWSMFQVYGLYQVPYGALAGKPFSVSMWINPTTTFSSALVQMFATSLSTLSCVNLVGIYSVAGVIGQLFVASSNGGPSLITGPFITLNTWSHVSVTYSPTNGYTLYYNGVYYGATGAMAYTPTATFAYVFVGYSLSCAVSSVNFAYQGSIDELYIHSRELTQTDVTGLANP